MRATICLRFGSTLGVVLRRLLHAAVLVSALELTLCTTDPPSSDRGVSDAGVTDAGTTDAGLDSPDSGPWINPGCAAPVAVFDGDLRLAIEVDLARYDTREYAVRERITVRPDVAGEAITLFGAALLPGDASHGYVYDGQRATFCTGPFDAGDEVTVEVDYVVSEEFQHFPPGSLGGLHPWGGDDG